MPASAQKPQHILEAQQFDRDFLNRLFDRTDMLEQKSSDCMRGKLLVSFIDESSTRTRFSFAAAAIKLGGTAYHIDAKGSSDDKGESVEDTILTLATIGGDVIVIRHHDEDAVFRAALVSPVPLINAGSGSEQHPTQALLDAYTIRRGHKDLDGLSIALVGDLKYGRTTNSLAYLLTKFEDVTLYLVSPDHLRMKGDLRHYLHEKGVKVHETTDFDWVLDKVDVIYQTRAQKERSQNVHEHQGLAPYVIDRRTVALMKKGAVILHPWPRGPELSREIDGMPQQMYIKQMYYGRLVRMALLAQMFD